jgi:hypothetical protein
MKKWFSLLLLGLLSACSSSTTPTQHYLLPDSAFRLPENRNHIIGVKIILSDPLKGENLLYQTNAHTLNFAQKNLWAAPLDEMLAASLSNKLNATRSNTKYIPAKLSGSTDLTIYLDRFQGSYTGETEISGYAQWKNTHIPFHINTVQKGNGYPAMIDSLNIGLDTVAQKIAPRVN